MRKISENFALSFKKHASISWNYDWNTATLFISRRPKRGDKGEVGGCHSIPFWQFTTSNVVTFPIEYSHVMYVRQSFKLKQKCTAIPVLSYYRPIRFRKFQAQKFHEIQHTKLVRLSALLTSRIYPPGDFPGTLFC